MKLRALLAFAIAIKLVGSPAYAQQTSSLMDVTAGFVQTTDGTRNVVILTKSQAGLNICPGWPAGLILHKEKIAGRPGLVNAIGCWKRESSSNITFRYRSLTSGKVEEFGIPAEQLRPMKMNDNAELF